MTMSISEMKRQAREQMKSCKTNPYILTLVYLIISYIVGSILIFFNNSSDSSAMVKLVAFIIQCVTTILETGYLWWALSAKRGDDNTDEFISAFKQGLYIIIINFICNIFIALGLILLIIPGIIVALGLSMAMLCFRDAPDDGFFEAIKNSWSIMKGNKFNLFMLYLSFIPWVLLMVITLGIAGIYVIPYMNITIANFYDEIC